MKVFWSLLKLKGVLTFYQYGGSNYSLTLGMCIVIKLLIPFLFLFAISGVSDADKGIVLWPLIFTMYYAFIMGAPMWALGIVHDLYLENIECAHKWALYRTPEKFFRLFVFTKPINRHYLYWVIWLFNNVLIVFSLWSLVLFPILRDVIFLVCVLEVVSFAWFSFMHALVLFAFSRFKSDVRYVITSLISSTLLILGAFGLCIIGHIGETVDEHQIDYQLFIELFTPMLWWLLTAAVMLILFSQRYSYRKFKEIHEC